MEDEQLTQDEPESHVGREPEPSPKAELAAPEAATNAAQPAPAGPGAVAPAIDLDTQRRLDAAEQELATVRQARAELEEQLSAARAQELEAYRRAILAENRGQVVEELVRGSSTEELETSVVLARGAFDRIVADVRAHAAAQVPVGGSVNAGPDLESLTPTQKINRALSRNGRV